MAILDLMTLMSSDYSLQVLQLQAYSAGELLTHVSRNCYPLRFSNV